MTLTELDRRDVLRAFDRAAARYDEHAVLQQEIESRLLERLGYFGGSPARLLDLGCGTGQASHELANSHPETLVIGLDWSREMLRQAGGRGGAARQLCADMRRLPLADRSVGTVFSNLALQWQPDLAGLVAEVRRVMTPGGVFLFSTFGPGTLAELRSAWAQVDRRPHVNRFVDMHDIGDALIAAGFRDPVMEREDLVLTYPDVLSLMRELKGIGAHNAAVGRTPTLTGKGRLRAMLAAYEDFRSDGRYPATFEVVYGTARAPADGQPLRTPEGEVAVFPVESLRRTKENR